MKGQAEQGRGRVAKTAGVSMMPEVWDWVYGRVENLRPKVSSISNYIQQLIEADKRLGLLGDPDQQADSMIAPAAAERISKLVDARKRQASPQRHPRAAR